MEIPKLATLCYVPRHDRLWPLRFLKNMDHFKHKYPIIYFSDYDSGRWADFIKIENPDPLKASKNKTAVQNFLWLNAIMIATNIGLDRFCYIESDVRVGCDNWDEKMFSEWVDGSVCMGTPNIFSPDQIPKGSWPVIHSYIQSYTDLTGLPVAQFLANEKTKRLGGCVFHMGAGAIYDTSKMLDIFPGFQNCLSSYACRTAAFDLHIGLKMFQIYGPDALRIMPFLTESFSGFGNKILNYEQRVDRLRSGDACLIHQVKTKDDLLFNEPNRNALQRTGRFN